MGVLSPPLPRVPPCDPVRTVLSRAHQSPDLVPRQLAAWHPLTDRRHVAALLAPLQAGEVLRSQPAPERGSGHPVSTDSPAVGAPGLHPRGREIPPRGGGVSRAQASPPRLGGLRLHGAGGRHLGGLAEREAAWGGPDCPRLGAAPLRREGRRAMLVRPRACQVVQAVDAVSRRPPMPAERWQRHPRRGARAATAHGVVRGGVPRRQLGPLPQGILGLSLRSGVERRGPSLCSFSGLPAERTDRLGQRRHGTSLAWGLGRGGLGLATVLAGGEAPITARQAPSAATRRSPRARLHGLAARSWSEAHARPADWPGTARTG